MKRESPFSDVAIGTQTNQYDDDEHHENNYYSQSTSKTCVW